MGEEKKQHREETVIRVTPEDGFVSGRKLNPGTMDRKRARTHFYGYGETRSTVSRDPRVHKVFLTWFTRIMVSAGILALLFGQGLLGLVFIVMSVFCCKKAMAQVEVQAQKENISLDMTPEEFHRIQNEEMDQIVQGGKSVFHDTFTPAAMENFEKKVLPFYIGLCGLLVLGLSYVSKGMSVVVLVITIAAGFFYHAFLKFLVKKSQSF